MRTALAFLQCWLIVAVQATAEENKAVELVLSPQAVETPVLKYRLLPAELELKEGNAATILLKLPWDQVPYMDRVYPTLHDWSERPLDAPEWADFTKEFVLPDNFYGVMKRAAYRSDADWAYPIDEEPLYFILLPDLQGLRSFLAYGLSARAKYHLSRGELDQAREVIMVGFANGRHVAQGPFLVTQMVCVVIHSQMLDRTAELIAQPDSPNLYWALSSLPSTLVNPERATDLEADQLLSNLPASRELDRPRDPAEWTRMADQLIELLRYLDELPERAAGMPEQERNRLVELARAATPELLIDRVGEMSDDEALIRWFVRGRTAIDHQSALIFTLPPLEARPQLRKWRTDAERYRAATGLRIDEDRPRSTYLRLWSVNRKIQALRIVEAVRHHIAAHDGRFPGELSEIADLPIPLDPLTDQPFEWTVDRATNSATLKSPPISSDFGDPSASAITYELRVR